MRLNPGHYMNSLDFSMWVWSSTSLWSLDGEKIIFQQIVLKQMSIHMQKHDVDITPLKKVTRNESQA